MGRLSQCVRQCEVAAPGFEQARQFGCDFVASISLCVRVCVLVCVCHIGIGAMRRYCCRCQTVRQPQSAGPESAGNATNKARVAVRFMCSLAAEITVKDELERNKLILYI